MIIEEIHLIKWTQVFFLGELGPSIVGCLGGPYYIRMPERRPI